MSEIDLTAYRNIEWLGRGKTINPIVGCNGPNGVRCVFCYAQRRALRFGEYLGYPQPDPFVPAFHPHRLDQIRRRKKPTVWFFGSMCDHLDDGVEPEWRRQCYEVMAECDQHIFVTLTKQYTNLWKIAYDSPGGVVPPNVIAGISVCYRDQVWGIDELLKVDAACRMISFEPMKEDLSHIVDLDGIQWVVIGAQSKQPGIKGLPSIPYFRPDRGWVQRMVAKARKAEAKVFLKPNLNYVELGWFDELIEEVPWG